MLKLNLSIVLLLSTLSVSLSQDMYKQFVHNKDKFNFDAGLHVGEPLGLAVYIYRGSNCKSRRAWTIGLNSGIDGGIFRKSNMNYRNGTWEPGAWQHSAILYYTVPSKMKYRGKKHLYELLSRFNVGMGAQFGSRKFISENVISQKVSTAGIVFAVNGYLYTLDIPVGNSDMWITLLPELKYYSEIGAKYNYFRPGVSLLFSFGN